MASLIAAGLTRETGQRGALSAPSDAPALSPGGADGGDARRPCPPCVHYAGSESSSARRSLLQAERGPCSTSRATADGAPIGSERAHAVTMAASSAARTTATRASARARRAPSGVAGGGRRAARRRGRPHRVPHAAQGRARRTSSASSRTSPTASGAACDLRAIPVSVLIETPGALHDAWRIAAARRRVARLRPHGLRERAPRRDPRGAMVSPGQFEHPSCVRAKCEIAAAALAHGVVPAHNVTRALDDPTSFIATRAARATTSATCACGRSTRRRSRPIVDAMRPPCAKVTARRSSAAQDADWGRCASTASCTTARRTASRGRRCSAPTLRASRSTARRRLFRRGGAHEDRP